MRTILLFLFLLSGLADAKPLNLHLVQYPIAGKQTYERFWQKVQKYVSYGVKNKSDVILFPELIALDMWPIGSLNFEDEVGALKSISQHFSDYQKRVGELAKKSKLILIAGTAPRWVDGKLFNTLVVGMPSGEVILQDKIHLTKWERERGFAPGKDLVSLDSPWGPIVILICYDSEVPGLSHSLVDLKPTLILVPSMTEGRAGRTRVRVTSQARSVEHLAYVALTGTVGKPSKDFPNDGQAFVFAPPVAPFKKYVLAEGPLNRSGNVFFKLDFDQLKQARKNPPVYPARDQTIVPLRTMKSN